MEVMMTSQSIATTFVLLAAAAAAQAGGTVQVSFVEPDKFTDAANNKFEIPATLKEIEQHLKGLGARYLSEGQVLNVEVTDVDLAGNMRPTRRNAGEIRVVRGSADWPRIKLSYVLEANGQTLKRGEEVVADLNYSGHGANYGTPEPLRYEKQMLEYWFKARFTAPH
jgi:hypothetical protein